MRDKKWLVAIAISCLTILASMLLAADAGQIHLSWQAPTANADGTALTDLAGYILYYGRASGSYELSIDVGSRTDYILTDLEEGQRYYFSVTAYDTSDNESDYSNELSAVPNPDPAAPSGLVAAYSFDAGSGTTVADASGHGNTGTISGATWTTQGKFGSALVFDGVDDWVTINAASSLDLTTGMTLSAWVYPTVPLTGWRTVIQKEQSGGAVYYLHANSEADQPATGIFIGGEQTVYGGTPPAANTWTHLAATYDGTWQRLYINGVEVASRTQSGSIQVADGVLRIGGNSVWGEYFQGRLDEVRIYNRALSASEIQADMNTPLAP